MKVVVVAIACTVLAAGCVGWDVNAYLRTNSSGHVGCPPHEITIKDIQRGNGASWTAICKGRVYYCSIIGNNSKCRPRPMARNNSGSYRPHRAERSGCQYDSQCKGNRLCVRGRCQEPRPRRTVVPKAVRPATPASPAPANRPSAAALGAFELHMGCRLANASAYAARMRLKTKIGAVILSVDRGSAAQKYKLRRGDVIVGLATSRVKSMADVARLSGALKSGQKFHIVVSRGGRIYSFYMSF